MAAYPYWDGRFAQAKRVEALMMRLLEDSGYAPPEYKLLVRHRPGCWHRYEMTITRAQNGKHRVKVDFNKPVIWKLRVKTAEQQAFKTLVETAHEHIYMYIGHDDEFIPAEDCETVDDFLYWCKMQTQTATKSANKQN